VEKIVLTKVFEGLDHDARYAYYRELWQQTAQHEVITDFPLHLDIELSAVCNLKCRHCFQNGLLKGPLGLMTVELFHKIIDEGAAHGLCAIKLQVRGESLLHPQFFDCITYAKQSGILDVQVTTNATLLNQNNIASLFQSGLDGLIVSYDRHHRDAVSGYDYNNVEKNIRCVLDHRAKLASTRPWVRIQASIEDGSRDEITEELKTLFPEANSIDVNKIHIFDYEQESYPGLTEKNDLLPCNYPMQRLAIYWNGDVTACCMDYNNLFEFGNVNTQTMYEIWNSDKVKKFRNMHIDGRRLELKVCNRCLVAIKPKQ
jgi:radical SAM protein with 4Fe4S-binding SPASM domain